MQTIDSSCSYYDPCGGLDCHACNDAVALRHSPAMVGEYVKGNPVGAPPGVLDGVFAPSGMLKVVVDCQWDDKPCSTLSLSSPEDEIRAGRACGGFEHLRSVKENKHKRRAFKRMVKNLPSLPEGLSPEGIALGADTGGDRKTQKTQPNRSDNKFSSLEDDDGEGCSNAVRLRRKAENLVSYLSDDLGIEGDTDLLPPRIECGYLRSAVRGCFPVALPSVAELSIKTVQKVEISCCKFCRPRFGRKLDEWKEAMSDPVSLNDDHLLAFRKAFRSNVPRAWNRHPGPYIPNGSATLGKSVKDGGNWNEEDFSDLCRAALVFSNGKPRVVTCYAEHNVKVLTPLHASLYQELGRRGWLLVGDPTSEQVTGLNGDGEFLSFDYVGATDSIKRAYVEIAIEVLIELAEDLSQDEERCMRVLSELRLYDMGDHFENLFGGGPCKDGIRDGFQRGQPMGSPMSFPVLCLVNKTIVDLSLNDLLLTGAISFKEWSAHRCLINGDDLLLREPRTTTRLSARIAYHGSEVGMCVNKEKSMVSAVEAEVNSTLFVNGKKEKKTNAKALYMKPDVDDVLGLSLEATREIRSFIRVVESNARLLARQSDKKLDLLPYPYQAACRKSKKIKKALFSLPDLRRPQVANMFPTVPRPDGFCLSREETVASLNGRVEAIRGDALELQKAKRATRRQFKTTVSRHVVSWRSLTKKRKAGEDVVLKVLADAFREKQKRALVEDEAVVASAEDHSMDRFHDESMYPNKIEYLVDAIRREISTKRVVPKIAAEQMKSVWRLKTHIESNLTQQVHRHPPSFAPAVGVQ